LLSWHLKTPGSIIIEDLQPWKKSWSMGRKIKINLQADWTTKKPASNIRYFSLSHVPVDFSELMKHVEA